VINPASAKIEEDVEAGRAIRHYLEFEDAIPGDELYLDRDFEVSFKNKFLLYIQVHT
jgi:hypothetical protein